MSLFNYYAIQTALRLSKDTPRKWKVTEDEIKAIEAVFKPYLDDDKLVLTPRFNGNYISFRYCGLEVLQLSQNGTWNICIEWREGKIRRADKQEEVASIGDLDLQSFMKEIRKFLEGYLHNFQEAIKTKRQKRMVPGFSLEHWMESIILADTTTGKKARKCLGLNQDLQMVVSQVPVIMNPRKPDGKKCRSLHIDLLSINDDGRIVVVELKKDDDFRKAFKELQIYTNWLFENSAGGEEKFAPERGKPSAMVKEHYLPGNAEMFNNLSSARVDAVAVVVPKRCNDTAPCKGAPLGNGVSVTILELPENWLSEKGSIFSA